MIIKVLKVIMKEIKDTKYFSLSVDSTSDISHNDQFTVVIRYIRVLDREVVEHFLTFIPIVSHTGGELAQSLF